MCYTTFPFLNGPCLWLGTGATEEECRKRPGLFLCANDEKSEKKVFKSKTKALDELVTQVWNVFDLLIKPLSRSDALQHVSGTRCSYLEQAGLHDLFVKHAAEFALQYCPPEWSSGQGKAKAFGLFL